MVSHWCGPDPQIIWKTPKKHPGMEQGGRSLQPFILRRRQLGIRQEAACLLGNGL